MVDAPSLYDEKEVMEEFISCYRHFTPLWDSNTTEYLSKQKKEPGYQELLKILRRVNHDANIQDVKRKINSLRCCYRREIKKIEMSYGSYKPRLWWFHMMDFIKPVLNFNVSHRISKRDRYSPPPGSLNESSMNDDDIFPEIFPSDEHMLVMKAETEAEVNGELDGDVDTDADPDVSMQEGDIEGSGEGDHVDDLETSVVDMEHLTLPKPLRKYHTSSANSNNNNNNNNRSSSINNTKSNSNHTNRNIPCATYGGGYSYPYGGGPQQTQQQHMRRNNTVTTSQLKRRRRCSSSYADAEVDGDAAADADADAYAADGSSPIGGASSSIKQHQRQRQQQQQLQRRQLIADRLANRTMEREDNECDLIGKRMAAHFRNMRTDQRLFAERIISEVLVYGRMNRLSLNAKFLPDGNIPDPADNEPYSADDGLM